jgi:hypothetical protein
MKARHLVFICVRLFMYVCMHDICMYVCMLMHDICMYASFRNHRMNVCGCIYAIYICMHKYIHTYTYTHIHVQAKVGDSFVCDAHRMNVCGCVVYRSAINVCDCRYVNVFVSVQG